MTRVFILIAATFSFMSAYAGEPQIGYSGIAVRSGQGDYEPLGASGNVDGERHAIEAAVNVSEHIFLTLGHARYTGHADRQFIYIDAEEKRFSAGIGYHRPVAGSIDVVLRLDVIRAEADSHVIRRPTFGRTVHEEEDTGWMMSAGLRGRLSPRLEWFATLAKPRVMHDSSPVLDGGLRLRLASHLAIEAACLREPGFKGGTIGIRGGF